MREPEATIKVGLCEPGVRSRRLIRRIGWGTFSYWFVSGIGLNSCNTTRLIPQTMERISDGILNFAQRVSEDFAGFRGAIQRASSRYHGEVLVTGLTCFRRSAFVSCFVSSLLLHGQSVTAQIDPRINEFLTSINKDMAALAGQSEAQAAMICRRVASATMDMEAVVRGASTHFWASMSPQQRDAYRAAALRWVVRSCVQRNRDNSGDPLEFVGVRQGDTGDRLVATRSNQPSHVIVWRLRGAGKLRAVDLMLDGASMMLSLRDETKVLLDRNNNDIDTAIESLGR